MNCSPHVVSFVRVTGSPVNWPGIRARRLAKSRLGDWAKPRLEVPGIVVEMPLVLLVRAVRLSPRSFPTAGPICGRRSACASHLLPKSAVTEQADAVFTDSADR